MQVQPPTYPPPIYHCLACDQEIQHNSGFACLDLDITNRVRNTGQVKVRCPACDQVHICAVVLESNQWKPVGEVCVVTSESHRRAIIARIEEKTGSARQLVA